MGIVGSAIGGTLGIGASIFGGMTASKAMKRIKRDIEKRKRENKDWYDRRYNEDATQKADAQRLLNLTEEAIRKRNRAAAGTSAVMGSGTEAVAAEKSANNSLMANTISQIQAQSENRKDLIESQYRQQDSRLDDMLENLEQSRAQNTAQAVIGAAQTGAGIASAL